MHLNWNLLKWDLNGFISIQFELNETMWVAVRLIYWLKCFRTLPARLAKVTTEKSSAPSKMGRCSVSRLSRAILRQAMSVFKLPEPLSPTMVVKSIDSALSWYIFSFESLSGDTRFHSRISDRWHRSGASLRLEQISNHYQSLNATMVKRTVTKWWLNHSNDY